ncbi:MAG TPA: VOC family protein [Stellaceae bacterium]|nr:VOC family protein [Stellaceae bacterium]
MIDHISLRCRDITRARAFYDAVLAPLGYRRLFDFNDTSGYGVEHIPGSAISFWIGQASDGTALSGHLCFRAPSRAAVDAFHRAALAAGGRDDGKPGLRPLYHPNYYAAFVLDPDGHKIEAVRHQAE